MWSKWHTSEGVRTSAGTVSGWRVGLGFITTTTNDFQNLPRYVSEGGNWVELTSGLTYSHYYQLYHFPISPRRSVTTGNHEKWLSELCKRGVGYAADGYGAPLTSACSKLCGRGGGCYGTGSGVAKISRHKHLFRTTCGRMAECAGSVIRSPHHLWLIHSRNQRHPTRHGHVSQLL
jgi:hypothetical protein